VRTVVRPLIRVSRNASHALANLREAVSGCARAKIQRALRERQLEEAAAVAQRRAATSPQQRASSSAPMMGGDDADATNTAAVSTEGQRCSVCRKPIKVRSRFHQNEMMTAARRLTPCARLSSSRPACEVGARLPSVLCLSYACATSPGRATEPCAMASASSSSRRIWRRRRRSRRSTPGSPRCASQQREAAAGNDEVRRLSLWLAWIGSPCLRRCVHRASVGGRMMG
jgi:hypothetical protein